MPSRHALLGPSSAHIWAVCTPAARLAEKFPDETSVYAEEGTRAHALAENKLKAMLGMPLEVLDFEPDDEMKECTEEYKDFVEEEFNAAKAKTPDAKLFIEQELDLSEYVPESFGTSDAVIISDDTLEVVDFKYGKGVAVNPIGNPQLRLYALGAYAALGCVYDFDKIKTTVFQPRIHNIGSEVMPLPELLSWADTYLKPRAELAFKGEGDFVVGEHCRFCKAGNMCRARAKAAFEVIEKSEEGKLLSDDEIAPMLAKLDVAENWIASIREYAKEKAITGYKWPGYKLVEGRSIRKITDPIAAASALEKAGYSREDYVTEKLKGITDLERLVGKKDFERVLGKFVVKPQGKPTLVSEEDKRPEFNPAVEAFKEE